MFKKEHVSVGCCCLEFVRKRYEIEICEFYQISNANILGLRDPNLRKFFPEMVHYYSSIINILLNHCENFTFHIASLISCVWRTMNWIGVVSF